MASIFEHDDPGALNSVACPDHISTSVWIRDKDGDIERVEFDDPEFTAQARAEIIQCAHLHNLAVDKRMHDALVYKRAEGSRIKYKAHRIREAMAVREGFYPPPSYSESEDDGQDSDDGYLGHECLGLFSKEEVDAQMRLTTATAASAETEEDDDEKGEKKTTKSVTGKKEKKIKKREKKLKHMAKKLKSMNQDVTRLEQQIVYGEKQLDKAQKKLDDMEKKLSQA